MEMIVSALKFLLMMQGR